MYVLLVPSSTVQCEGILINGSQYYYLYKRQSSKPSHINISYFYSDKNQNLTINPYTGQIGWSSSEPDAIPLIIKNM